MTTPVKRRCGCARGARRGDYDLSQCRLCWHELNTRGWLGPVPQPVPEVADCCGGRRVVTVSGGPVVWALGVTTVPEREELLHRTLGSLAVGGFGRPQVFVERGLRAFGTWWHSLVEMWIRNPDADRYGMFQDDMVCCRNLRVYLDGVPHPERGYWNLFSTRDNEEVVKAAGDRAGWYEAGIRATTPHDPSCTEQTGRGALALVFPRRALLELLTSRHLVERPMDKVHRNIDGCVVTAMNKAGYREYVHAPSLVQHVGDESVIGWELEEQFRSLKKRRPPRVAKSFPGESFDAMSWLTRGP